MARLVITTVRSSKARRCHSRSTTIPMKREAITAGSGFGSYDVVTPEDLGCPITIVRKAALGAERKLVFEVRCFRFCSLRATGSASGQWRGQVDGGDLSLSLK